MPPEPDTSRPRPGPRDPGTHVVPGTYLTAGLRGIGGRLKARPEDFLVEEIPLYQPSGEGEHIYLFVEKRGLSTLELVGLLAGHFGVRRSDVGYAGLKDKDAVTRQVMSVRVPGRSPEDFPRLRHDRVDVLWVDRHANKLRPGHLRGNRFSVKVRGVGAAAVLDARRTLDRLVALGVPNRVGEQRFGSSQNNHRIGLAIIRGDADAVVREMLAPSDDSPAAQQQARRLFAEGDLPGALAQWPRSARAERAVLGAILRGADPQRAVACIGPTELRYYVTAFQSAVFNAVLDRRVSEGLLGVLREGDLAWKHDSGAVFAVTADVLADPGTPGRLAALGISPSGPLWGRAMTRAAGETGRVELDALHAAGASGEDLDRFDARFRGMAEGARRPLRVPLAHVEVEGGSDEHGPYVRCAFDLPPGAFATVVMREVMKPELCASPAQPAPPDTMPADEP